MSLSLIWLMSPDCGIEQITQRIPLLFCSYNMSSTQEVLPYSISSGCKGLYKKYGTWKISLLQWNVVSSIIVAPTPVDDKGVKAQGA